MGLLERHQSKSDTRSASRDPRSHRVETERDRTRRRENRDRALSGFSFLLDAYQIHESSRTRRSLLRSDITAIKAQVADEFAQLAYAHDIDQAQALAFDSQRGIILTSESILAREERRFEFLAQDIRALKLSEMQEITGKQIEILQSKIDKRWGIVTAAVKTASTVFGFGGAG